METMIELMEQQELFYVETLNRQETNFMSFTKMILESSITTSQLQSLSSQTSENKEIRPKIDYLENESWQNGLIQDNVWVSVRYWTEGQIVFEQKTENWSKVY